jgi:2-desacetyl-2-hydroxyethyl bacteriochlorophyllide A dehydrogenase
LKAVVKKQRGDGFVELLDVTEPIIGDNDVLLEVNATGICGSDLMILHNFFPGYNVPVILGHEFAGLAKEVGVKVTRISPGDRIVSETHAYVCGNCTYCKSGLYNLCYLRKGFGYGLDGAFTKYVRVREPIIHKLTDKIDLDEAAALEPLAVAVNALTRNARIFVEDSVLIIGPGPIGLLALQIAKLSGAKSVTVVGTERSRKRLDIASRLGADTILTDQELNDGLSRSTEGYSDSFDVVIITTGTPTSFEPALRAVRKAGTVIHIGESTKQASFQFSLIEKKNLTVQGSFSHNWPIWEKAISLVENEKIDLSSIITHKVRLEDWRAGFDIAESREGLKVLIKP